MDSFAPVFISSSTTNVWDPPFLVHLQPLFWALARGGAPWRCPATMGATPPVGVRHPHAVRWPWRPQEELKELQRSRQRPPVVERQDLCRARRRTAAARCARARRPHSRAFVAAGSARAVEVLPAPLRLCSTSSPSSARGARSCAKSPTSWSCSRGQSSRPCSS
jgi:hypothetical protein